LLVAFELCTAPERSQTAADEQLQLGSQSVTSQSVTSQSATSKVSRHCSATADPICTTHLGTVTPSLATRTCNAHFSSQAFIEPASNVIITLLQSGLLDKLIATHRVDPLKQLASNLSEEVREELGMDQAGLAAEVDAQRAALLEVFSAILFVIPLPKRSRTKPAGAKSQAVKDPADVDPAIAQHIAQYNSVVLQKFSSFVRRYAAAMSKQAAETDQLPGTSAAAKGRAAAAAAPARAALPAEGTVLASIRASTIKTAARSPFVAVSGNSDDFNSLPDLVGSLKDRIYLTDFFAHGERAPLAAENGLRDASLYDRLNEFCHALRVIKNALGACSPRSCSRSPLTPNPNPNPNPAVRVLLVRSGSCPSRVFYRCLNA
jgi:hypothetical protein